MMLQQQQQEAQDKSLRIISMEVNYKCVFVHGVHLSRYYGSYY